MSINQGMNPNFDSIGNAFVRQYYAQFDSNRAMLAPLYRDDSMLTFEGQQFQGANGIVTKLQSLPFQTVSHVITTVDCQPAANYGILVHVIGQLKTDNDPPHGFSQTFCLKPGSPPSDNIYCFNDIFRLALHHG